MAFPGLNAKIFAGRSAAAAYALLFAAGLAVLTWALGKDNSPASPLESAKPSVQLTNPRLPHRAQRADSFQLRKTGRKLESKLAAISLESDAPATTAEKNIFAANFSPLQTTALQSLYANAPRLTHLLPQWLHLAADGQSLDLRDWDAVAVPHNLEVLVIARENGIAVMPVLDNFSGRKPEGPALQRLFRSEKRRRQLAHSLKTWLVAQKFPGLNLNLPAENRRKRAGLVSFLKTLHREFQSKNLSISLDLRPSTPASVITGALPFCDFLVLKAFDQHPADGPPGPLAADAWFNRIIGRFSRIVPAAQLVIGVGSYAYDWRDGKAPADPETYLSAVALAAKFDEASISNNGPALDSGSLNTTFDYRDDQARPHKVWLLDGISFHNQWQKTFKLGLRGTALWSLGTEDPSVWSYLAHDSPNADAIDSLKEVDFTYEARFRGKGEILSIEDTPVTGKREITPETGDGLITGARYERYPAPIVVRRSGYVPKMIALTFDDGPDPGNTPRILDVLKQENVKGTFFVVGKNAALRPDLVRRAWDEGHDIGVHSFTHPNLALLSERGREFELDATQRVLQGILQHSSSLFRIPYNSDAEPSSGYELIPLITASRLNYVTVAGAIDPQDWNVGQDAANGWRVTRDPRDIAQKIIKQAHLGHGNIVVLHDGGGDRTPTALALPEAIEKLKAEGYQFVTVSELLGLKREQLMPPVERKGLWPVTFFRSLGQKKPLETQSAN